MSFVRACARGCAVPAPPRCLLSPRSSLRGKARALQQRAGTTTGWLLVSPLPACPLLDPRSASSTFSYVSLPTRCLPCFSAGPGGGGAGARAHTSRSRLLQNRGWAHGCPGDSSTTPAPQALASWPRSCVQATKKTAAAALPAVRSAAASFKVTLLHRWHPCPWSGRLKGPDYVAVTTQLYRHAIDAAWGVVTADAAAAAGAATEAAAAGAAELAVPGAAAAQAAEAAEAGRLRLSDGEWQDLQQVRKELRSVLICAALCCALLCPAVPCGSCCAVWRVSRAACRSSSLAGCWPARCFALIQRPQSFYPTLLCVT